MKEGGGHADTGDCCPIRCLKDDGPAPLDADQSRHVFAKRQGAVIAGSVSHQRQERVHAAGDDNFAALAWPNRLARLVQDLDEQIVRQNLMLVGIGIAAVANAIGPVSFIE